MRRKVIIPIIGLFLLMACARQESYTVSIAGDDKMEGMKHLYESNTYGYYFGVDSDLTKGKTKSNIIEMNHADDSLYLMIESAGMERQIAVQVFMDYEQIPIIVDGSPYFTYYINAGERYSEEIPFQLGIEVNEQYSHKMVTCMTVSSDLHECDTEGTPTNVYSLAYDWILKFDKEQELFLKEKEYQSPTKEYQDMWNGLLINNDITELKRTFPPKEIQCSPGEKIELQYQIGGLGNCEEVLMLLSLDMKQIMVDNKNYLVFRERDKNIMSGTVMITAPEQPGLYDLTGWIIEDPFKNEQKEDFPLAAAPRFTIHVTL